MTLWPLMLAVAQLSAPSVVEFAPAQEGLPAPVRTSAPAVSRRTPPSTAQRPAWRPPSAPPTKKTQPAARPAASRPTQRISYEEPVAPPPPGYGPEPQTAPSYPPYAGHAPAPGAMQPLHQQPPAAGCPTCPPPGDYVDQLYGQAYGMDPGDPCYGCPAKTKCKSWSVCGMTFSYSCECCPSSTCDMFPHYPYFPAYHGHYYFRPYNYQTVFLHQRMAECMGLDPANPYSLAIFDQIYQDFYAQFPPRPQPVGSTLPAISNLPQLESLVPPRVQ